MDFPLSDVSLSQRLERCERDANAASIEARRQLQPEVGAEWIEVSGAYAMFDGRESPLTQTFGFGMFAEPRDEDLATLEEFFASRDASAFHEVSPLASPETLRILGSRGYRPVELTSVLYQPIGACVGGAPKLKFRTRVIEQDEEELWSATAAEGWGSESAALAAFVFEFGRITAAARGTRAFLAEIDGRPVAAGALAIHGGVALLAGASTIPTARRQGAQRALLDARLRYAAGEGCDLAMMCALPGSASQRNAERQGFRIAYTRIKWGRPV